SDLETDAIWRAQSSINFKSAACPFPFPYVLVGVFTEINIMSASSIAFSTSVEKNKFLPRASETTKSKPGSYTGSLLKSASFHASIRALFRSTTVTSTFGFFCAMTDIVGPPTYPAPIQVIFFISFILQNEYQLFLDFQL